ncbi:MAG: hypothetical protein ACYTBS_18050, partial [Planctomycetota bacterium]
MFVNTRILSAIVLAACLLGRPAVGRSAIPAEETTALRAALEDISDSFGDAYPKAAKYLTRLNDLERRGNRAQFERLRREALIAN